MFSTLSFNVNVFASLNGSEAQVAIASRNKRLPLPWLVSSRRLFLFLIAVVPYLTSLDGDFVFDDSEVIVHNKDVVGDETRLRGVPLTSWLNFVFNDYWGTPMSSNASHKSWRPLTILSFKINYFCTRLNTRSYHVVNLVLHGIVTVLSYELYLRAEGVKRSSTALLASIIFAVHPVHSECVANVSGRAELLSAVFFLLSFLWYDSAIRDGRTTALFTCLLFSFAAMLSKEQGITSLGVCLVYEIVNLSSRRFEWPIVFQELKKYVFDRSATGEKGGPQQKCHFSLATSRCAVVCLFGCLMTCIRLWVMCWQPPSFSVVDNPQSHVANHFFRMINYGYLYTLNMWLLLSPASLCFDYSMGCIPLISQICDIRVLYVVLFCAAACLALYRLAVDCLFRSNRPVIMGASLLVIPFIPASNVFFKVGFVLAERVLYLPSLGISLIIVIAVKNFMKLMKNDAAEVWWRRCILFISVIYFAKSTVRSSQWRTEESLYSSGLLVCPGNAKIYYNIAKVSLDGGRRVKALDNYRFALQLYPDYEQALNNLANLLKDEGELLEAERLLERAVKLKSDFTAAWMNLGTVKAALKKYNESEKCYLTALKYRPKYADCLYNLGNLYVSVSRKAEALSCWSAVTKLRPDHSKAWTNIFVLLESEDRCAQGIVMAEEALRLVPHAAGIHFSVANCLGKLGHYDQSEYHFLAAINLDRFNAHYFANLGVLYHRWKKYKLAREMYLKAKQLNPNLLFAERSYKQLLKDAGG